MKSASQLLSDHLKYKFSDTNKWLQLFAPNAQIDLTKNPSEDESYNNLQIYSQSQTSISADYDIEIKNTETGEKYWQNYVCHLKSIDGRIVFLQERTNNTIF